MSDEERPRPLTVEDIAVLIKARGDTRKLSAIKAQVTRALRSGLLGDAAWKTGDETAPWLVWPEAVQEWLDSPQEEPEDADV